MCSGSRFEEVKIMFNNYQAQDHHIQDQAPSLWIKLESQDQDEV